MGGKRERERENENEGNNTKHIGYLQKQTPLWINEQSIMFKTQMNWNSLENKTKTEQREREREREREKKWGKKGEGWRRLTWIEKCVANSNYTRRAKVI